MTTQITHFDSAAAMMDTVPPLDQDAQRLARELYRQLAQGEPVPLEDLATALDLPMPEVKALLQGEQLKGWVFYNDQDRIIGFRGLAIRKMPHRFVVDGQTLYTWCAIDSLFIPDILGKTAQVESRDPNTGTVIRLTVTPDGVQDAQPADMVMSILLGDPEVVKTNPTKVMASFCHHIFFLESPETGADWTAQHGEGTFLVTLDEAFALGKRFNAAQFA